MKSTTKRAEGPFDPTGVDSDEEGTSSEPAHHARRPMNAFLIFCKRHRSVVRERYPTLENRCITKILGEWWAQLEPPEKACYTELAKQYKEAFLRANPDFKWYKLPAPPLRTLVTRPSNQKPPRIECPFATGPIVPGKLADESQLGGLSSLLSSPPTTPTSPSVPKPPKKRYLEEAFNTTSSAAGSACENTETVSKEDHSCSSPDSDGKDSGTCAFSPSTSTANTSGSQSWSEQLPVASTSSTAETTVQASQQQLIERVVDHMCGTPIPQKTPAVQTTWEGETNNNESTCVNVNAGEPKDLEETENDKDENEECKPGKSSEVCDGYSEADSALLNKADYPGGMLALGDVEDVYHENPSTSAEGRRKSFRACKGKRYQEFMSTGRLATGKRNRVQTAASSDGGPTPVQKVRHDSGSSTASEKTDSAFSEGSRGSRDPDERSLHQGKITPVPERHPIALEQELTPVKQRRLSETSEESFSDSSLRKRFRAADFNLDEKIEALPSLSLEEFQQKKKAKKKRISCSPVTPRKAARERTDEMLSGGLELFSEEGSSQKTPPLVGSQKRKARRLQITRLDPNTPPANRDTSVVETDVLNNIGLATLAEVASAKRRLIKQL